MQETNIIDVAVNAYFILAIGYNVLSVVMNDVTGRSLSPTDPVSGIMFMTLLYLVYVGEALLGDGARTALLILFLLLISRFGIYRHLVGYDEKHYHSRSAWALAIAINLFGVTAMILNLTI